MILAPEINSNVLSVFVVSNLHAFCSIRFCQIRSKKNDDFDEITPFFVLFLSKYLIFDEIVLLAFFVFSEKIKNLVLPFISAQNVPENHQFSMKTIYKPTTFCGEGFLGLDSIQLLQNSQKIYFSYSLLNYKICVFFTQIQVLKWSCLLYILFHQ